jgi:hypothetical protein
MMHLKQNGFHRTAETLYKEAINVWTNDVFAYHEMQKNYITTGRALPISEYPAHPPPYKTYANHDRETYERGME